MSSVNLPSFIQKVVDEISIKNGFRDYCVLAKPSSVSGFGGGMLSIAIIENGTDKEMIMLCKTTPHEELLQGCDVSLMATGFNREVLFYDKIVPLFAQFQKEKNLPEEDQFLAYPKCYAIISNDDRKEYAILMEDLRPHGFNVWDKPNSTPIEHLRLSMRELGKFHGLSFALKDQKPQQFAEFKKLEDIVSDFAGSVQGQKMFNDFFEQVIKSLRDEGHKNIICEIKNNLVLYFTNCVNNETTDRFGVISHGDFHNNNILYQLNEKGTAEDIRIVDWQTIRYFSPVIDIIYSIFPSTQNSLRDRELYNLLTLYQHSLSRTVTLLGSNPEELFTLKDMYDEIRMCGNYAIFSAPTLTQLYQTMMNKEEKTFDEMHSDMNDEDQLEYDERINEVIGDMITFGCYRKVSKD